MQPVSWTLWHYTAIWRWNASMIFHLKTKMHEIEFNALQYRWCSKWWWCFNFKSFSQTIFQRFHVLKSSPSLLKNSMSECYRRSISVHADNLNFYNKFSVHELFFFRRIFETGSFSIRLFLPCYVYLWFVNLGVVSFFLLRMSAKPVEKTRMMLNYKWL